MYHLDVSNRTTIRLFRCESRKNGLHLAVWQYGLDGWANQLVFVHLTSGLFIFFCLCTPSDKRIVWGNGVLITIVTGNIKKDQRFLIALIVGWSWTTIYILIRHTTFIISSFFGRKFGCNISFVRCHVNS